MIPLQQFSTLYLNDHKSNYMLKIVMTLLLQPVDEVQMAGYYQVSFEINNLAEGIYYYTLELKGESGSYSKTTKNMLLIK